MGNCTKVLYLSNSQMVWRVNPSMLVFVVCRDMTGGLYTVITYFAHLSNWQYTCECTAQLTLIMTIYWLLLSVKSCQTAPFLTSRETAVQWEIMHRNNVIRVRRIESSVWQLRYLISYKKRTTDAHTHQHIYYLLKYQSSLWGLKTHRTSRPPKTHSLICHLSKVKLSIKTFSQSHN